MGTALADEGGDNLRLPRRQVELGEHPIGRRREVGSCVKQGAVEIHEHGAYRHSAESKLNA